MFTHSAICGQQRKESAAGAGGDDGACCWFVSLCFHKAVRAPFKAAVFDQSGGAIAGATVTVTDVARGLVRTLTTDSAGAVRGAERESRHVYGQG